MPVAFIETAWRRYTKHSRNKVQEIQGAIIPLAETYRNAGPFKGAVLAGIFTDGALNQLKSLGFAVLFFPYETILSVFKKFNIDAYFDEETPDAVFQQKVSAWENLQAEDRARLSDALLKANRENVRSFIATLTAAVSRQIDRILVLPLHGTVYELATVDDAVKLIERYNENSGSKSIDRYEIEVRYNNGNVIEGKFKDKASAVEFLRGYQPIPSEQA